MSFVVYTSETVCIVELSENSLKALLDHVSGSHLLVYRTEKADRFFETLNTILKESMLGFSRLIEEYIISLDPKYSSNCILVIEG